MRRHRKTRRERKKQRKFIILGMICILGVMSAGYAAFSTNLNITAKGNILEKSISPEDLLNNVVTSGDGIYKDVYEENRYIYRGGNPDNYIEFNDELWRIISVENDGTLKIIRNTSIGNKAFDSSGLRTTGYCSQGGAPNYGCNAWMTTNNFVSADMSGAVNADAELNTYLNTVYYNSLTANNDKIKIDSIFNVGVVSMQDVYTNDTPLSSIICQEKKYQWKGKIALPTVSEYVQASNYTVCINAYAYRNNENCYNSSEDHNWMFDIVKSTTNSWMWLLSPLSSDGYARGIFSIGHNSVLRYGDAGITDNGVAPVLYLIHDIKLKGHGTYDNPYIIV